MIRLLPERKANRLPDFDYSSPGIYFLTLCAKDKAALFGSFSDWNAHKPPKLHLSSAGECVENAVRDLDRQIGVNVLHSVLMPNHLHLLLRLSGEDPVSPASRANQRIPRLISAMKRRCNAEAGEQLFQRSYYDHVIRDEADFRRIWEYIETNPMKWSEDRFYTD